MEDFVYYCPTRIVFGKGSIAKLGDLVPQGSRILMTFGGGSIRRNGVYDQVRAALAGRQIIEFGGIPPNPVYERLMEAAGIVRKEKIGFLLAVGGGSVLDGTKFISVAALHQGADPWDIVAKGAEVTSAVPLGCVLTLPATGSEMNSFAVISRNSTREKLPFQSEHVVPRFSILDPKTTFSLPAKQVRNGIVDAYAHVMEQYATYPAAAPLQERQAEAILATLIEEGPRTLARPKDYNVRANLVWCATQALNGLIGCGVPQDWATHMIGHELTAFYGMDHAESLAVVLPSLLVHELPRKADRLAQYGRRVWGLDGGEKEQVASAAIDKTRAFFESIDMRTRLADYGISAEDAARKVSARMAERKTALGEHQAILPEHVAEILRAC